MTIDPIQAHRDEIASLSRRHAEGDLSREQFLEESRPHAEIVLALEAERERDAIVAWVKVALANPLVVESLAIGAAHYLRKAATKKEG